MNRKVLLTTILFSFLLSVQAQLKSPEEFLGYKIGSRYTPHWKIVNYFNHVAANSTATVKLEKYGETNEGRPLLANIYQQCGKYATAGCHSYEQSAIGKPGKR